MDFSQEQTECPFLQNPLVEEVHRFLPAFFGNGFLEPPERENLLQKIPALLPSLRRTPKGGLFNCFSSFIFCHSYLRLLMGFPRAKPRDCDATTFKTRREPTQAPLRRSRSLTPFPPKRPSGNGLPGKPWKNQPREPKGKPAERGREKPGKSRRP